MIQPLDIRTPIAAIFRPPTHEIENGNELEIDLKAGVLTDLNAQRTYPTAKIPAVMLDILNEGGLVPYLKKHGDYQL